MGQLEHRAVVEGASERVVPYRLPLPSMTRPAIGLAPLVPLNEASVVSAPLPWVNSNTVPSPEAPPADAVPYRLPLLSMTRAACGPKPAGATNEASVETLGVSRASNCSRNSGADRGRRCGGRLRARRPEPRPQVDFRF